MVKKVAVNLCALLLLTGCACKRSKGVYEEVSKGGDKFAECVGKDGDKVYFAFDKSDITAEANNILQMQSKCLGSGGTAIIEGHCDERGTREYNMALGKRRAEAVKSALVNLGVKCENLTTTSYGKDRPQVVGKGEAVYRLNRRAVTVPQN